jgi:hypothetical protein
MQTETVPGEYLLRYRSQLREPYGGVIDAGGINDVPTQLRALPCTCSGDDSLRGSTIDTEGSETLLDALPGACCAIKPAPTIIIVPRGHFGLEAPGL